MVVLQAPSWFVRVLDLQCCQMSHKGLIETTCVASGCHYTYLSMRMCACDRLTVSPFTYFVLRQHNSLWFFSRVCVFVRGVVPPPTQRCFSTLVGAPHTSHPRVPH